MTSRAVTLLNAGDKGVVTEESSSTLASTVCEVLVKLLVNNAVKSAENSTVCCSPPLVSSCVLFCTVYALPATLRDNWLREMFPSVVFRSWAMTSSMTFLNVLLDSGRVDRDLRQIRVSRIDQGGAAGEPPLHCL